VRDISDLQTCLRGCLADPRNVIVLVLGKRVDLEEYARTRCHVIRLMCTFDTEDKVSLVALNLRYKSHQPLPP
jgi:hypothetical protein